MSVACLIAPHAPPPIPLPQHAIPQRDSSVRNLPATQQEVRDREGRLDGINWAEFQAIQQQARTLDGIMVQNRQGPVVKLPGRDDFPITAGVSDNFFDVLGVQAAMGRVFHAGSGADGQVVLTDRYWKTAFGGDSAICGRTVAVGRAAPTVIGVLPPGFSGSLRGIAVDLFVPHQTMFGSLRMGSPADPKDMQYEPLIRLKLGVTLETARLDMDQVLRQQLSESLLLAAAGTALGLLLADWLIDFASALLYAGQRYSEYYIRLDARVFAFSAGAMLLVTLVALAAATIPARRAAHADPVAALRMESLAS